MLYFYLYKFLFSEILIFLLLRNNIWAGRTIWLNVFKKILIRYRFENNFIWVKIIIKNV